MGGEAAVGTLQDKKRPRLRGQTEPGAGLTGIEPATSGVTDRHSNQLSYSPLPDGAPEYRRGLRSIQRRPALERFLDLGLRLFVLPHESEHLVGGGRMDAPA